MLSDLRGREQDIQDCSGAISSQFIQRASNPWTDRSCLRRYFLSPWKIPALKESWIYWEVSQLAASTGLSTEVSQTTAFPSEQIRPAWAALEVSGCPWGTWNHADTQWPRWHLLPFCLPMYAFRSTQHLHSWATAAQAVVCTINGKYTSSTLLLV